jgi:hypothetical protein
MTRGHAIHPTPLAMSEETTQMASVEIGFDHVGRRQRRAGSLKGLREREREDKHFCGPGRDTGSALGEISQGESKDGRKG